MPGVVAQGVDQGIDDGRTPGGKGQRLPADRMRERQPLAMQCLAPESTQDVRERRPGAARQLQAAAVQRVADQPVAGVRHVHADLVCTAGFQVALDQAVRAKTLAQAVMGDGMLAAAPFTHRLADAVARMPSDRRVHGAAGDQGALDHGLVLPGHLVPRKHGHQARVRGQRPRHHHQAGGVLVQAVHDARARQVGQRRIVVQQPVQQRAVGVAGARVHDQAGRLGQHQQVGILVADVQVHGLRAQGHFRLQLRLQDDDLAAVHALARYGGGAVDMHAAGLDPRRQPRSRIIGEHLRQSPIQALSGQDQGHLGLVPDTTHAVPRVTLDARGDCTHGRWPVSAIMAVRPISMPTLPMRVIKLFCIAALVFGLASCSVFKGRPDLNKMEVGELYNTAHSDLQNGSYVNATRAYKRLIARFPYGKYNQEAQIELAYAQYKDGKPDDAYSTINRFIKTYPAHKHIAYAYYLRGLINFNRSGHFAQEIFGRDARARHDQGYRLESFDDFSKLTRRYPDSKYAADARQRMIYLRNGLAHFEINVAEYYLRTRAYIAAAPRPKYVSQLYQHAPQTGH